MTEAIQQFSFRKTTWTDPSMVKDEMQPKNICNPVESHCFINSLLSKIAFELRRNLASLPLNIETFLFQQKPFCLGFLLH